MKKVFHLISHFDMGGAERVAASIAKSQSPDFEYHVVEMMRGSSKFTDEFISELEAAGVKCHRAYMPDIRFHFLLERITALLFPLWFLPIFLRYRPDVIHSHTELPDLCILAFSKVFPWLLKNCRIVRTIHNTRLWTGQKRVGIIAERFFQKYHSNVAISVSVQQSYIDVYGEKAPIIYNGVAEVPQKRYENLRKDKINVIFAGRFETQKGISRLIEIIQNIKSADYHFHIFGDGTLRQDVVNGLGNRQNVTINPPLFGLSSYLSSFDYMLMPSEFEGLSIVAIEASMAGLPNVINSCLGLEETLPDDWQLKVKDNDLSSYLHLFDEVIPFADKRKFGEIAKQYVMEHFSVYVMQKRYEERYNKEN